MGSLLLVRFIDVATAEPKLELPGRTECPRYESKGENGNVSGSREKVILPMEEAAAAAALYGPELLRSPIGGARVALCSNTPRPSWP